MKRLLNSLITKQPMLHKESNLRKYIFIVFNVAVILFNSLNVIVDYTHGREKE